MQPAFFVAKSEKKELDIKSGVKKIRAPPKSLRQSSTHTM